MLISWEEDRMTTSE